MNRKTLIKLLLALLLCGCTTALAAPRQIVLHVDQPDQPWGGTHLSEKLIWHLSKVADLRILSTEGLSETAPQFPAAGHDLDSLLDWGKEIGSRYILSVTVDKERLETRKRFVIPLILHRYTTAGVIEGEIRLVDVHRGRVLAAERFSEAIRARQVIQGDPDQNQHDPDLHVPADEKADLFVALEDQLADRIARKTRSLVRGR